MPRISADDMKEINAQLPVLLRAYRAMGEALFTEGHLDAEFPRRRQGRSMPMDNCSLLKWPCVSREKRRCRTGTWNTCRSRFIQTRWAPPVDIRGRGAQTARVAKRLRRFLSDTPDLDLRLLAKQVGSPQDLAQPREARWRRHQSVLKRCARSSSDRSRWPRRRRSSSATRSGSTFGWSWKAPR